MELFSVQTARYFDAGHEQLMLLIEAEIGGQRGEYPFLYDPIDPHGLAPDIAAWIMAHEDLVIDPYVPPGGPPRDALAELDALKSALIKKSIVTDGDIRAEEAALADVAVDAVKR